MTALLQVRGLRKSFAEFAAVAGVDLAIPEGGITAIIGPNGAGKTTLINLLTGKLLPDAGQVTFAGVDVTRLPTSARVRAGMSRTFQVTNIFPRLSTGENVAVPLLGLAGQALNPLRRIDKLQDVHQAVVRLLGEVGLEGRDLIPAAQLSHGDRRLLEIAMALATSPRLLLFDEPTAGMGSGERERVLGQIRRLAAGGKLTILLIEHDMELVFGLAGRIVVLHQGKVIADAPPQAIREDARVRDIYLGAWRFRPGRRTPGCIHAAAGSRSAQCRLWPRARASRRDLHCRPRRDRRLARPKWRRQDNHAAQPRRTEPTARAERDALPAGATRRNPASTCQRPAPVWALHCRRTSGSAGGAWR